MSLISRRLLLATATATLLPGAAAAPPAGSAPLRRTDGNEAGLHSRASRRGLFYGSAIESGALRGEPALMEHIRIECGMLVSEANFKWADLHPAPDKFSFERADMLTAYAARQAMRVRGHTLVWHEANPDWLEQALTPGTGEKLLTGHIGVVAGHFRRRLAHWDVVNEPLKPEDGKPFGLRDSLWLRALGPRYLDIAFHACAAADPDALRVVNEFGTDYAIDWQERKRQALLTLLADLKARNVPVQAVGLQAHLDAAEPALDQTVLNRFVADIAALGMAVIVTELDVRDDRLPADIATRDAAVAAHARAWLEAVLAHPAVLGVLTWGLSDKGSWLDQRFPRPDGLPQRPLPLDARMQRKPLWSALAAALDAAPARVARG
jgi:endo-1,4-beta-xylanase